MELSEVSEITAENSSEPPKKRKNRRILLKLIAALMVLLGAALVLAPYGIKWGTLRWLGQNGLENASITDVDLNLFTGRLVIEGLDGGGAQRLKAGRAEVAWRTGPLFSRKLYITAVGLYDAAVDLELREDGTITAGGLILPQAAQEASSAESATARRMGGGPVAAEPRVVLAAEINRFTMGPISAWEPERDTPIGLDMTLNGAPVRVAGTVRALTRDRKIDVAASIEDFDLEALAKVAAEQGVAEFRGILSASQQISGEILPAKWSVTLNTKGKASVRNAALRRDDTAVSGDRFDWDGTLAVAGNWEQPKFALKGKASLAQLDAAAKTYALQLASGSADIGLELSMPAALQLNTSWKIDAEGTELSASGADLPPIIVTDNVIAPERGQAARFALNSEGKVTVNAGGGMAGTLTTHAEAETPEIFHSGGDAPLVMAETFTTTLTEAQLGGRISAPVYSGRIEAETRGGRVAHDGVGYAAEAGELSGALVFRLAEAGGALNVEEFAVRGSTLTLQDLLRNAGLAQAKTAELALYGGANAALTGNLRLEEAEFVDRAGFGAAVTGEENAHLLRFAALEARELDLNPEKPAVGEVMVQDLTAWVHILDSGAPEALAWLAMEEETTEAEASEPEREVEADSGTSAPGLPPFRIARLVVEGDNRISLRDMSVNPPVRMNLAPFTLRLGPVDSTAPDALTSLSFDGRLGEYSALSLEGEASLLAPRPSGTLLAEAKGVDLHEVTAYIERFAGYRLNRGTLDSKVKLKLDAGRIDAHSETVIARLELERMQSEEVDPFEEQIGMPLNAAISLLRNREDNIRLDIPVTGDLSDPQIDVSDAVGKAVMRGTAKAVKTGVMTYFAPVGVAVLAGKAAQKAYHLRFDPVTFEAGDATLDEAGRKYLDTLAQLLQDRPKVSLTLCGFATHEDLAFFEAAQRAKAEAAAIAASAAVPKEPAAKEQVPAEEFVPVVREEVLLDLAVTRAGTVKAYLADTGGIESARLLSCAPTFEPEAEEGPHVAIRL